MGGGTFRLAPGRHFPMSGALVRGPSTVQLFQLLHMHREVMKTTKDKFNIRTCPAIRCEGWPDCC